MENSIRVERPSPLSCFRFNEFEVAKNKTQHERIFKM